MNSDKCTQTYKHNENQNGKYFHHVKKSLVMPLCGPFPVQSPILEATDGNFLVPLLK